MRAPDLGSVPVAGFVWSTVKRPVARAAPREAMLVDEDWAPLLLASADVNVVTDHHGVYRHVSSACERVFGWTADDLEGRREEDFVETDDQDTLTAARRSLVHMPDDAVM